MADVPRFEKLITFFGQRAKVACDGLCAKAWGSDARPRVLLSNEGDGDDFAWLSDDELGAAPLDPGTTEGGDSKPLSPAEFPNRWCVRACERCSMSRPGESHIPLNLRDFSRRFYNFVKRQNAADAARTRGEPDPNPEGALVMSP